MKCCYLIALLTLLCLSACKDRSVLTNPLIGGNTNPTITSEKPPKLVWEKTYKIGYKDYIHDAKISYDGNYYLSGRSYDDKGSSRMCLMKISPTGDVIWQDTTSTSVSKRSFGVLSPTIDGGCIISESSTVTHNIPVSLNKYSISGQKEWESIGYHTYHLSEASSIILTKDGGFIYGGTGIDLYKMDNKGNMEWGNSYGGNKLESLGEIVETSDGGYILIGSSDSDPRYNTGEKDAPKFGRNDGWIVKIDSHGKKIWDKSYGGDGDDEFSAAVPLADGSIIIGGGSSSRKNTGNKVSENFGSVDYWLVRIDKDGQVIWDYTYGGDSIDRFNSMALDKDGNIVVCGESFSNPGLGNRKSPINDECLLWMFKINQDGKILWQESYPKAIKIASTKILFDREDNLILFGVTERILSGEIPNFKIYKLRQ